MPSDNDVLTWDSSLASNQKWAAPAGGGGVEVKDNGTPVGTRAAINLIEGSNVTLTIADDGGNDEVDITIASSGGGGGGELDYAERTSDLSITATSEASPVDVVTGAAVAYDGSTVVIIEFFAAAVVTAVTAAANLVFNLWDGGTDLGRIAQVQNNSTASGTIVPVYGRRRLTPSAATHTYSIKAWRTVGNGSLEAASPHLPTFIRITEA